MNYYLEMQKRADYIGWKWEDTGGHVPVFFKKMYGYTLVLSINNAVMYKGSITIEDILEGFGDEQIVYIIDPTNFDEMYKVGFTHAEAFELYNIYLVAFGDLIE